MAPFLINHPKLIHQWIEAREIAISRVLSIRKLNKYQKNKILYLIEKAYLYTTQWKVDDLIQLKGLKILEESLKKFFKIKN